MGAGYWEIFQVKWRASTKIARSLLGAGVLPLGSSEGAGRELDAGNW